MPYFWTLLTQYNQDFSVDLVLGTIHGNYWELFMASYKNNNSCRVVLSWFYLPILHPKSDIGSFPWSKKVDKIVPSGWSFDDNWQKSCIGSFSPGGIQLLVQSLPVNFIVRRLFQAFALQIRLPLWERRCRICFIHYCDVISMFRILSIATDDDNLATSLWYVFIHQWHQQVVATIADVSGTRWSRNRLVSKMSAPN